MIATEHAHSSTHGPCARPVQLAGTEVDASTGEVLGRKTVERRCGSRLASRCPSCSALYAADDVSVWRVAHAFDSGQFWPANGQTPYHLDRTGQAAQTAHEPPSGDSRGVGSQDDQADAEPEQTPEDLRESPAPQQQSLVRPATATEKRKRPNKLFVGHGRNKKPLEQLTNILRDLGIPT